ncbi:hypothetical protein EYF80_042284 [Liparis tanakae]|uniref:Uncharacterized protein n=1 Tax=Liparis tanakae TaxID=230148 RepID=A0A4Z2G1Y0_9TELE|nr:hypothetical protein EYF80_042284 [Liparis tanakae]
MRSEPHEAMKTWSRLSLCNGGCAADSLNTYLQPSVPRSPQIRSRSPEGGIPPCSPRNVKLYFGVQLRSRRRNATGSSSQVCDTLFHAERKLPLPSPAISKYNIPALAHQRNPQDTCAGPPTPSARKDK